MPTVDERLAFLEVRVDAIAHLQSAISEFRAEMNLRFERVDQRFEKVDRRAEILEQRVERHFMWMVGIQFTVLIAVIVALIQMSPR